MERFRCNIIALAAYLILLAVSIVTLPATAAAADNGGYDSVKISLLTCSPHQQVYSLYGHTAIRYQDEARGQDVAVNYGIFNSSDGWFVPAFIFGITDYSMGIVPFGYFVYEYQCYGSSITQQELNLTAKEKQRIAEAIEINYRPENRIYRYNYFYKNCSTMARDIIARCIDGKIVYPECIGKKSFRQMIHECNGDYPWARLGNDLLLGMKADMNTDAAERQFLPMYLMDAFAGAVIADGSGSRPLVKSTSVVLEAGAQQPMDGFPMSPLACALMLMALCLAVTMRERAKKMITLWLDAVLMAAQGTAGIVILLMFFSAHPTTSTNLMILMLNPMPLFFVHRVYAARRKGSACMWWKAQAAMAAAMIIAGALLQDIDTSMFVVAAAMLIRAAEHIRYEKKMIIKK